MVDAYPIHTGNYPAEYLRSFWWSGLIKGIQDKTPIFGALTRRATLRKIISRVQDGHAESVRFLAYIFIKTEFAFLRRKAREILAECQNYKGVNHIWRAYAETRHPALEALLREINLFSDDARKEYVLSILVLKNLETIQNMTLSPEAIPLMAGYCEDPDPKIAHKAQQTLLAMDSAVALDALVDCFIQTGNTYALQTIQKHHFQPEDLRRRTTLSFLTEDLAAYDLLDFDRRVLSLTYQESPPDLRRRMIRIIQSNGRADLLTVVTGSKDTSRIEDLTAEEMQVLVDMQQQSQNWPRLWELIFELPPKWSLIAFRSLLESGYEPSNPDDLHVFRQLKEINPFLPNPHLLKENELFPVSFRVATIKVPGRINDIAFAPSLPQIAIGTGLGKVALWDYEKAEMTGVIDQFDHSVGNLAYTKNGALVCGERANPDMPCALKIYQYGQLSTLGRHAISIRTLAPVGANRLISASSDREVSLWDTEKMHQIDSRIIYPYPRAVTAWPDGSKALLISKTLNILDLNTMAHQTLTRRVRPGKHAGLYRWGTGSCAVFHPNGQEFFLGISNGLVWHYQQEGQTFYCSGTQVTSHIGQIRNLFYLDKSDTLITGGGEGSLHFIHWPTGRVIQKIQLPEKNLTSFHLSYDQTIMATGNADAEMSIWDLRSLGLADLSKYFLANSTPLQISALRSLAEEPSLKPDARQMLAYIECLLLHRHRHDIEIAAGTHIKRGQFDIILSEE
jgi:WD40 repeat protein